MTKSQFIHKSKREIIKMLQDKKVKITYFESRKGIPQMMTIIEDSHLITLFFDKTTRRVTE